MFIQFKRGGSAEDFSHREGHSYTQLVQLQYNLIATRCSTSTTVSTPLSWLIGAVCLYVPKHQNIAVKYHIHESDHIHQLDCKSSKTSSLPAQGVKLFRHSAHSVQSEQWEQGYKTSPSDLSMWSTASGRFVDGEEKGEVRWGEVPRTGDKRPFSHITLLSPAVEGVLRPFT